MIRKIGENITALKVKIFHNDKNNGNPAQNEQNSIQQNDNTIILNPENQSNNVQASNDNQKEINQSFKQENIKQGDQKNVQPKDNLDQQANQVQDQTVSKNLKLSFSEQIQKKIGMGNDALKNAIKKASGQINEIKNTVSNEYSAMDQKYKDIMRQQKDKFNIWIRLKVENAILKILEKQKPKVKRLVTDPYMFKSIKQVIHDMVDEIWPSIEESIKDALKPEGYERMPINIVEEKPKINCLLYPWYLLKSWYLYTTTAYNRTIWQKIRRFSWWFILLINLFPLYGASSFLYGFYFLLIDKQDEWQLLLYIVSFKKMQFFSVGVTGSLLGYALFFFCSTVNDYNSVSDYYKCKNNGPGSKINIVSDIVGFLLQIVLCWIAFLLLPCSKQKGQILYATMKKNFQNKQLLDNIRKSELDLSKNQSQNQAVIDEQNQTKIYNINYNNSQIQNEEDENQETDFCCLKLSQKKGGRIKFFMIYDIFIFAICLALIILALIFYDDSEDWQKYQFVYLMKTVYGFFNFPWLVFLFSPMMKLLTKAKETGYDRYGVIQLMYINKAENKKKRQEELQKEKSKKLPSQQHLQDIQKGDNNQSNISNNNQNDLEKQGLLKEELNIEELIQQ
ncbi:transmembrane protein, putative (macronuclear) [Tetrahymena thermophila SB210]|uniref:Transmembrane protein, putative n=1 Tax=Tetrahymena thermophila (strain SB210) TaxID=312017 RepID=Q22W83_TETTS|nr:transmembrane protein, putative [Tetrahymena thermophila SB210]EAR89534.2 transmembrane protein, putative [Tetrahymena thermophila SB210]|eukprot:XP_001009779.2 transmembrane protein, putative [Tetrahymena thermophila SB210]